MDTNLQQELAIHAGENTLSGDTQWVEDYRYHLGAVENPLPFELFRIKYGLLHRLLNTSVTNEAANQRINQLCRELGY